MDLVAQVQQQRNAQLALVIGVTMQRKSMDQAKQMSAQLLATMPPPPSLEPGRGTRIDVYA